MNMSDLSDYIHNAPLIDTHEHLKFEEEWVQEGPDVLQDIFGNYIIADLVVAGASQDDVDNLLDINSGDIGTRFSSIEKAWDCVKYTGYGEAVGILARDIYGLEQITIQGLLDADIENKRLRKPGNRLKLLKEHANIDHVQIDNFVWRCEPDQSGSDFFLYDLSWVDFCNGVIPLEEIYKETGISVKNIKTLEEAMELIFEKYGPYAIAVKSQHAYSRTLKWIERTDQEAEKALNIILCDPENVPVEIALCLGDWAWAKGIELSIQYNLPFKIHTGYYAGHSRMPVNRIKSGNMCELLARYIDAKFILMHIAYPYSSELIAIAKHYPNVWVDLCWAWSIDPYSSFDFVRRFIHAVPINKLFAFGGDTQWPTSAYAYSVQTRKWFTHVLQTEIKEGFLNEKQALSIAHRLMEKNQKDCFDIDGTRENIIKLLQPS